jgi:uncharacterized membrane-anchored protein
MLVLNFIADMSQLQLIETKRESVLALADFDQGSRYLDFDPDIDQVAAYGLGALVAEKVLAKTGLLVILRAFLKKFEILIVIGVGAFLKTIFSRRKEKVIEDQG